MKPVKKYDIVVIGSGLGGLVTGLLLAKSGRKVCILEKNNQLGGNLQTFVRDKTIFDSGVHYIGSLDPRDNLGKYFSYLDVLQDIEFEKMDEDGFDYISFGTEQIRYPQAQGHTNFVAQLLTYFPDEKQSLEQYIQLLEEYCYKFPLYHLTKDFTYPEEMMKVSVSEVLDGITPNKRLRAVLLGNGFLYGLHADSPFYVHALIINSYIKNAWRCVKGGSQITKAFTKQLRKHKAELLTYQKVTQLNFKENHIESCETEDYKFIANQFISNICLKQLFSMFDEKNRKKPYIRRIESLKDTPSAFSTHLVLHPNTVAYFNHNIYHFEDDDAIFSYENIHSPRMMMISSSPQQANLEFASNISMLIYMNFNEVKQWEQSKNLVHSKSERGPDYELFKQKKADQMIDILEKYFPQIRSHIKSIHTSSPLTFRDYIGTENGTMYGFEKEASQPLKSLISPKTKIDNLVVTGQSIRLHGILGVTITGFLAAAEILGRDELFDDLINHSSDV